MERNKRMKRRKMELITYRKRLSKGYLSRKKWKMMETKRYSRSLRDIVSILILRRIRRKLLR
jgi:hypothetical protein